jgi:hypothetical protein
MSTQPSGSTSPFAGALDTALAGERNAMRRVAAILRSSLRLSGGAARSGTERQTK